MRRRTRSGGSKPSRTWYDVSGAFTLSGVTVTSSTNLLNLQAPAATVNLSSDPVEDLVVLRLVGDYEVQMASAVGNWTLALLVQDTTWTPSTTFASDSDKRVLWSRTYDTTAHNVAGYASSTWSPPGSLLVNATTPVITQAPREAVHIDIAPKVVLEPGKALVLVAYENSGTASMDVNSTSMRMLFQRRRRR